MDDLTIPENVISTPLCVAARNGDLDILRRLLKKGHNVNLTDNRGWSPLFEAVAHGRRSCANELLLHEACRKDVSTYDGRPLMYLACQYQDVGMVKLLLEHGVNCNKASSEDVSPLHVASKLYKFEIVKELIEHGVNVNAQDFNNFTPLMEAIDEVNTMPGEKRENALEIVRFLLDHGTKVDLKDTYGRSALHIAACVKWDECCQLLHQYGFPLNERTRDGSTALLLAAQSGNLPLVKYFLDNGARTDLPCDSGTVPLHHALHNGHISVAEELIKETNWKNILECKFTESFLILAIDSGCFEAFKLVMEKNIYSTADSTPVVKEIVSYRNYRHCSPLSFLLLHHMDQFHAIQMVMSLIDYGHFQVNAANLDFIPPLVALIAGSTNITDNLQCVNRVKLECFKILIERGADIDYCSDKICPGNLNIPDAVITVIKPRMCSNKQNLLLPVLAHSFVCDWDDLIDWLMKNETCNADVLYALIKLGSKSQQSLQKLWENVKQCSCHNCEKEFPNVKKSIDDKELSLKSMSRAAVRRYLWQITGKSSQAERLLNAMGISFSVIDYIVPTNF